MVSIPLFSITFYETFINKNYKLIEIVCLQFYCLDCELGNLNMRIFPPEQSRYLERLYQNRAHSILDSGMN